MLNGDYSIPFSTNVSMKRLKDFIPDQLKAEAIFTMNLYMKFTGLPYYPCVIGWIKKNLSCRVNEEEELVVDPAHGRIGEWHLSKSSDWVQGMPY